MRKTLLVLLLVCVLGDVAGAQCADGWCGTGASGSWGGDSWVDYVGAALMVALQIFLVVRYGGGSWR